MEDKYLIKLTIDDNGSGLYEAVKDTIKYALQEHLKLHVGEETNVQEDETQKSLCFIKADKLSTLFKEDTLGAPW